MTSSRASNRNVTLCQHWHGVNITHRQYRGLKNQFFNYYIYAIYGMVQHNKPPPPNMADGNARPHTASIGG